MAQLNDVLLQGLRSAQPLATAVADGVLYYVTDEAVLEQSFSGAWTPYSSTVGDGIVRRAVVEIAHADILTLPTIPVELVAAPGTDMRVKMISYTLRANTVAGAYTGLAAAYSDIHLGAVTHYAGYGPINDNTTTPNLTWLSSLLGAAGNQIWDGSMDLAATSVAGTSLYVQPEALPLTADLVNEAFNISIENGGVNLGGGNALNTLKVILYYAIEDLS